MNPNLKPQDLLKGVTFASGGTGYDPLTAKIMVRYKYFVGERWLLIKIN